MELKFAIAEKDPLRNGSDWIIYWDQSLYYFEEVGITEWSDSNGADQTDCHGSQICILQHIGLQDIDGQDWYHMDIGEFENGDRFTIEREEWLEFYIDYMGDPEIEGRDFYRIREAKKIGNHYKWKGGG